MYPSRRESISKREWIPPQVNFSRINNFKRVYAIVSYDQIYRLSLRVLSYSPMRAKMRLYLGYLDIEDNTPLREDMDFMLEWQEQYIRQQ